MKIRKGFWTGILASIGLIVLILDAKTAISGAQEGLSLCIKTILPTLFPFCVLTKLINVSVVGKPIRFLRPVGKICGIPEGAESILALGFLGGYPVGAQGISDANKSNALSATNARRMLGFCNNAGPAFLFGILGGLFTEKNPLWCLWAIHIVSAVIVGFLLPDKSLSVCRLPKENGHSLSAIVEESIKTMALVCGWIILFRILLCFCQRWFLWMLPATAQVITAGFLELSNGCVMLYSIPTEGLRYIISSCVLGFGGICVAMQTFSIAKNIDTSLYFPGKVLQVCISFIMAWATQYILFSPEHRFVMPLWIPAGCISIIVLEYALLHSKKKVVAFAG